MLEVTQYELTVLEEPNGALPVQYFIRRLDEDTYSPALSGIGVIAEIENRRNWQKREIKNRPVGAPMDFLQFLEFSYEKSNEFRYLMADRLSAAMTKSSLASAQIPESFPGKVKGWLDDSIKDLEKASSILNEWVVVYERLSPSNLIGKCSR